MYICLFLPVFLSGYLCILFIFACISPRGRHCCWSGRWIQCRPGTEKASRWGKRKPRRQSAWSQRTRSWWRPSPQAAASGESSGHPERSEEEGEKMGETGKKTRIRMTRAQLGQTKKKGEIHSEEHMEQSTHFYQEAQLRWEENCVSAFCVAPMASSDHDLLHTMGWFAAECDENPHLQVRGHDSLLENARLLKLLPQERCLNILGTQDDQVNCCGISSNTKEEAELNSQQHFWFIIEFNPHLWSWVLGSDPKNLINSYSVRSLDSQKELWVVALKGANLSGLDIWLRCFLGSFLWRFSGKRPQGTLRITDGISGWMLQDPPGVARRPWGECWLEYPA